MNSRKQYSLDTTGQMQIETSSDCYSMYKPFVSSSQTKPSMEKGSGHEASILAEEALAIDSCWERERER